MKNAKLEESVVEKGIDKKIYDELIESHLFFEWNVDTLV